MPVVDVRVSRRYAQALLRVAEKRGQIDAVAEALEQVSRTIAEAPDLLNVLQHPRVTRARKIELVRHIFGGHERHEVENFLLLLIQHDRALIIPEVARQFAHMVDEQRHVMDVEAVTAVPLSDGQRDALRQRLEGFTGGTIRLQTRVDEDIMGGLVVRIGDKLIDGSVATRLRRMHDRLRGAKVA